MCVHIQPQKEIFNLKETNELNIIFNSTDLIEVRSISVFNECELLMIISVFFSYSSIITIYSGPHDMHTCQQIFCAERLDIGIAINQEVNKLIFLFILTKYLIRQILNLK